MGDDGRRYHEVSTGYPPGLSAIYSTWPARLYCACSALPQRGHMRTCYARPCNRPALLFLCTRAVCVRLAEVKGGAVLSKLKMPFAEAKTCTDYASGCSFCPCGAMRLTLRGATLVVNEQEVMLLHLAQSKYAWSQSTQVHMPTWEPPPSAVGAASVRVASSGGSIGAAGVWARGCYEVMNLGNMNETCSICSKRAPRFSDWGMPGAVEKATRLRRHRVQTDFRGHIVYPTRPDEVRLVARPC